MWGLVYVLNEQIFKKVSIITSVAITTLAAGVVLFIWAYLAGFLRRDFISISSSNKLLWFVIAEVVIFILAELLIALSITSKNATLSSLIEISYPIFVSIFAYLIFRENEINTGTVVGGLLIFIGVTTIYIFNK